MTTQFNSQKPTATEAELREALNDTVAEVQRLREELEQLKRQMASMRSLSKYSVLGDK